MWFVSCLYIIMQETVLITSAFSPEHLNILTKQTVRMGELPHLVKDLALILVVAGIVTIVSRSLNSRLCWGMSWQDSW